MADVKAIHRYHRRVDERLAARGIKFDGNRWEEDKHPRSKDGKFTSGSGVDTVSGQPEVTAVKGLPTAKEIGFKPKTKSKFRNKRDEIVARHKALREKNGEDGLLDCTVDPDTGDQVNFKKGFQVAFQTSVSEQDGDGHLSDQEYDKISEEISKQTGSKAYVGVFDEAETSFHCDSREQAMEIAKKYNQHSILDWEKLNQYSDTEWTPEIESQIFVRNPFYDPSRNHVKGE